MASGGVVAVSIGIMSSAASLDEEYASADAVIVDLPIPEGASIRIMPSGVEMAPACRRMWPLSRKAKGIAIRSMK